MRKNEKHVILCLLEVARIGARFGMEAPMLVQMERQIDREIAADNKAMGISIGTETDKMSHSISVGTEGIFDSDSEDEDNIAEEPLLVYGPQPQIITNDLKSLDEMVSEGIRDAGPEILGKLLGNYSLTGQKPGSTLCSCRSVG